MNQRRPGRPKKVVKKRAYKRRAQNNGEKTPSQLSSFTLKEGTPPMRRIPTDENLYRAVVETVSQLKVRERYILAPKDKRAIILRIAKREFPNYVIRTSLNQDEKTVSVWRQQ